MFDKLTTAILYYIIFVYVILEVKPIQIFDIKGKPKPFGFNADKNETPLNLLTVFVSGGIIIYYLLLNQID